MRFRRATRSVGTREETNARLTLRVLKKLNIFTFVDDELSKKHTIFSYNLFTTGYVRDK